MEFRNLQSFIKVAQLGSFSKAAASMGYNQSTVTIQIQKLEEELEVRLFDRLGKQVYLTEQGQIFYEHALKIIKEMNEALASVHLSETVRGRLRIGCIDSIENSLLLPLISDYYQQYPHVQLVIQTGVLEEMLPKLKNDALDLICTFDHLVYGEKWEKMIAVEEPVVCIGAQNYAGENIYTAPMFLTEKGASYRRLLEEQLGQKNVTITPKIESGNTEFILQLVKAGLGITFLPLYCLEASPFREQLTIIETEIETLTLQLQVIKHQDKTTSLPMQKFIELFQRWCEQRKSGMEQ